MYIQSIFVIKFHNTMSGNKKIYNVRLDAAFKEDIDNLCAIEGITFTELVRRELRRYIRAFKRAATDYDRKKKIENRIIELKRDENGEY